MSLPLPSYAQIEPVGQCNLRCQMCPIQFRADGPPHGPPAFMPFETFVRLVDQLPAVDELHLQGLGEPMMHPRFFDMVAYGTARGLRVTTNSNLTLLYPPKAEPCIDSGLERLHVSIDGATAETYEAIRVRGRFARVQRNLEALLAARDRLGRSTPHLGMVAVVMRRNLHELPDLVRLAAAWRMEELFVQHLAHDFAESSLPARYRPMRQFVDAESLLYEDHERIRRFFDGAQAAADQLGLTLRLPRTRPKIHPPGTPGRARCDWPWRGLYLSYDGRAMPCCMVATPDRMNFGSMADHGVAAVWENGSYETFRRALDSDAPPEICASCSVYQGTF
jgi:radical SAM protein with 4Fe4S-binding SPASM domain